ncbi:MAG: cupin domain-containing protein [Chlorobiaceae bacterium]|nr:cupin domain-containing protein [Chlorobiaceae bacterium]
MKNALRGLFYASVLLSMQCGVLHAEQYSNVEVRKILVSTKTSDGRPIQYLKTSSPEVTALEVTFPPGGSTGWHQHPVPVYAYVLDGSLTVNMENGQSFVFNRGDAIFEVMNTLHNGTNLGSVPVRLVVFYTGAVGVPNVIRQEQTLPQPRKEPAQTGE